MIRQYRAFEDLEEPCFLVPEPEWITVTYQMKSIICQWRWDEIKELVPKKLSPHKKQKSKANYDSTKDLTHSQTQIRPYSNSAPASPNLRAANPHYQDSTTTTTKHQTKSDPTKILKKNLLKIEFLKCDDKSDQQQSTPLKPKWYRFDTRDILDEFLSDANRHGYIERLVISRWFSTKVKYVPKCLLDQQQQKHPSSTTQKSINNGIDVENNSKKKDNKIINNSNNNHNNNNNNKRTSSTSSSSSSSSGASSELAAAKNNKKKTKKTSKELNKKLNNKMKNNPSLPNDNNNIIEGTRV